MYRQPSKGTLQEFKWVQGKLMCLSKAIFASKKEVSLYMKRSFVDCSNTCRKISKEKNFEEKVFAAYNSRLQVVSIDV